MRKGLLVKKVVTGFSLTTFASASVSFALLKNENSGLEEKEKNTSRRNLWFYTTGALRLGRTAFTIGLIVLDYKYSLHGEDVSLEGYQSKLSQVHTRSATRLRELCYKNSGCYIKVGQHLGVLDYLIPNEYVQVMKVLHNKAPLSTTEEICNVFRQEFGREVTEVFREFDPQPLASASLAQVHKAKLVSGEEVVVKIQHPTVMQNSHVDIFTMELLFKWVSKIFPSLDLQWLADETKKNLPLELDFVHEAGNNERAQEMFKKFKFVKIPKVYRKWTSPKVITMEFCEGGFINDRKYYQDNNIDVKKVMLELGKLYSEMIFEKGYIHCDPHPGNILVVNENSQPVIKLLDHGLYQELPEDIRLAYCKMWTSIFNKDVEGMKGAAEMLGIREKYPLLVCILTSRSWQTIKKGLDEEYTDDEDEIIRRSATTYLTDISIILNNIPRPLLLVLKTNDLIRGIERSLNCRSDASAFFVMFKSCVNALAKNDIKSCISFKCKVHKMISQYWTLLKLSTFFWLTRLSNMIGLTRKNGSNVLVRNNLRNASFVNLLTP
ncbi:hypothetical protein HELRODRAFT_189267 [Helobdella robusta]|uniref:ABC1 atypical kinase-like domain-containing protein n=1 Tax=Helobdella robusta TaxID=6412 RepID=T1FQW2_HELRO|nr:hypothetical protein HELRODRAFT_189267 [Helobdella robusta]ESN96490.1 hypothetical protein HELRODRAFT_189267 [Helobdella robusta]